MTDQNTGTAGMPDLFSGFFPWWVLLVQGLLALIIGILLLVYPGLTSELIVIFLGAYWFVSGIFALFSATGNDANRGLKILLGIIGIVLGLVILAYPFYSTIIVFLVFIIMIGIWALVYGGIHLYQGLTGGGWAVGILGLLSIIFGLLILVHPWYSTLAIPFVFGFFGIVFGFAAIVGAFMIRSEQKTA